MAVSNKFSCFIVGEGTLPIRCAEILLDHEHTIFGIISSDAVVSDWVRGRELPCINPKNNDIIAFLSQQPFDYLFSIVNPYILPEQILELPRRCAINYHDAPLPRYAGTYATSWAIMQGEKRHGVTWHVMTERVDAGDIVKQSPFAIADNETAFTLNVKCYDAAITSFTELIDELSSGCVSARQQNLNERTFFAQNKRPSSACVLSWNRSAREIRALVRALDFGPFPNPLGLPKLAVDRDFVIVSEIEVLDSMSALPSGTITHIDPSLIRVATRNNEIALHKLLTIDGQPFSISDFVAKFGLYEGYQFKEPEQEIATRITAYNASICRHEAFWTQRLEMLEKITLPYAHQKTSHRQTTERLSMPMPVPGEILNALEKRHATWRTGDFLLAAFVAYLARIGGMWSFDIGYRDIELKRDVADLEGIFAAYVPVRVMMEHKQSFEEVFYAVQKQVQLAKQRKTYVRDIMVRYPALRSRANLQGSDVPSVFIERVASWRDNEISHDSELTLVIQGDASECLWVCDAGMFDEESVREMQRGFMTFLRGIAAGSQRCISEVPLLTEAEQYRVLVEWNATQASSSDECCLPQLFEAQVARTPEAIAVVCAGKQLSYAALNARANQLAHYLRQLGVGPEVLVGVCLQRSVDALVALLGILKAGGAYVPIDPDYPAERLAFLLADTQMPVLLTQQQLVARIPRPHAPLVCLDSDWPTISVQSATNPVGIVKGEHLAYVIYTSGSTGQPKGVLIEQHAIAAHCQAMGQVYGLRPEDRVLQFSTLSFDASLEQILPTLFVGATLVMRGPNLWSSTELWQQIKEGGITVMNLPTAYCHHVLQDWVQAPPNGQRQPVRLLIAGGDRLSPDVVWLWQQTPLRSAGLLNAYGPTEATITTTLFEVAPTPERGGETIPIGHPLPHRTLYILDTLGQPVPVGVAGELHIGGELLARGYLHRPDLTAERFIVDPFSSRPQARLYKTGDLARYRADGTIEFLGRRDEQVKLRGYRIELGEIEAVLSRHPAVRQAVVLAREDPSGDKRLVAYVVLHKDQMTTMEALKSHVKQSVPAYMVPSGFMRLDALPQMPNGKVDRRALPAPDNSHTELERLVAPRKPLEEVVAASWLHALGREQVSINDDFFALGGHSLLAMQIIAQLRVSLHVEVPLSSFFKAPTVAQLAEAIAQLQAQHVSSPHQPTLRKLSREAYRQPAVAAEEHADSQN